MASTTANETTEPSIKRCAIYSRSSVVKDSLDPFDSVSAQFMACAEFIGSQVGKGWCLLTLMNVMSWTYPHPPQELATQWLWVYNNERPNTAIGGIPPRWLQ